MLDINLTAVITQIIGFLLLLAFMGKMVLPAIGKQLDDRAREIQETFDRIAADRKAMEVTRADYEQRLANIEADAREHVTTAVNQAKEEAAAILAKAREEATETRDRALFEIDQERKKAVAEIRAEMSDLAVLAATRILEREINPQTHRDLITSFVTDVQSRN